jgi:hypothetical protein
MFGDLQTRKSGHETSEILFLSHNSLTASTNASPDVDIFHVILRFCDVYTVAPSS